MENYIFWIVTFAASTIIGVVLYLLKKNGENLEKNDIRLQKEIETVKDDFNGYKLEAQREFVSKDEFIRAISGQDRKLDKIYDKLIELTNSQE